MATTEFRKNTVVLAWHVDYWDRLGWKDPFGSSRYTDRQRAYQRARKLKNIWTPMFCVDNTPTRGSQVAAAVRAAKNSASRFAAAWTATQGVDGITVTIKLRARDPKYVAPKAIRLLAILYEEKSTTECKAGENKGKTLREFFVVRDASKALDFVAAGKKDGVTTKFAQPTPTGPKGDPGKFGVALLIEDASTMRTIDCWWQDLSRAVVSPRKPAR